MRCVDEDGHRGQEQSPDSGQSVGRVPDVAIVVCLLVSGRI